MTKYLLLLYAVILGSASQQDSSTTISGKASQPDSSTTGAAAISQPDSSTTGVKGQIYKHPTTKAIMYNHSSSNRAFHTTVKLPSGITSAITDIVTTERATLQPTSKLKPIISTAITTERATLQSMSKLKPIISTAITDIVTTERATLQSTSKLKPIISTAATSDRTLHATVKIQESITSAFLSKPEIKYLDISNNQVQLSCFSESGSLPITYSIYNKEDLLQDDISYLRQPTNFTITLTPGVQVELMCQAENSDGVMRTYLSPIRSNKEEIDTPKNENKVEDDSSPKYIIALDRILTSVDPIAQQKNIFALIFSLSFIFCMLIVLGTINHFRKRCARMTKENSLIH